MLLLLVVYEFNNNMYYINYVYTGIMDNLFNNYSPKAK